MKILVIGGTRFFGKRLVQKLLKNDHEVTLITRGNNADNFGDSVKRITCDRLNFQKLKKVTEGQSWDLIYDQVCFDYKTAKEACEVFNTKTKRYIFTSTISTYESAGELFESDFNPNTYTFQKLEPPTGNYGEAKRQAEAAFAEFCSLPIALIRLPIVIGADDYTKRFAFHIDKVKSNKEVFFPNKKVKMSFVSSDDASECLLKIGLSNFTGPINVASPQPIEIAQMMEIIEKELGKKTNYALEENISNQSPYGIDEDWYINCDKLKKFGVELTPITEWLPKIIKQLL